MTISESLSGDAVRGEGVFGFGFCECGCGEETRVVKGRPNRFVNGHQLEAFRPESTMGYVIEDRGYETPCFIWLGNTVGKGYGTFGEGRGDSYRKVYAHRRAYEAAIGPIPEGLHIDHLCCVYSCVNSEHLEAVTPLENTRRGIARHGHPARTSALGEETIAELRRLVYSGECNTMAAARRLGLSKSHAYRILAGEVKSWSA